MENDMSADPDNDETLLVASTNDTLKDPQSVLAIVCGKKMQVHQRPSLNQQ